MKSPSSNVGIIESDGIRNGSNKKDRITRTIRITGKNDFAYSALVDMGNASACERPSSAASAIRLRFSTQASIAQTTPVTAVAITKTKLKSKELERNRRCTVSTPRINSTHRDARIH